MNQDTVIVLCIAAVILVVQFIVWRSDVGSLSETINNLTFNSTRASADAMHWENKFQTLHHENLALIGRRDELESQLENAEEYIDELHDELGDCK